MPLSFSGSFDSLSLSLCLPSSALFYCVVPVSPAGCGSVWRANSRPAGGWWSVVNEAGWGYCVIITIKERVSTSLFTLTQNHHTNFNNDKPAERQTFFAFTFEQRSEEMHYTDQSGFIQRCTGG